MGYINGQVRHPSPKRQLFDATTSTRHMRLYSVMVDVNVDLHVDLNVEVKVEVEVEVEVKMGEWVSG